MTAFFTSQRRLRGRTSIGPALLVVLWAIAGEAGWISPLILPPPHALWEKLGDLGFALVWHTCATYARVLACSFLGFVVGIGLGLFMQYSERVYIFADGVIESWRPVPVIALIPFAILVFGFSEAGKLIIGSLGVVLIMVVSATEAVGRTPRPLLLLGTTAGLSRREIFSSLVFPSMLPRLKAGARVALAGATTLVIATEFMGAEYGLGYLINTARVTLSTSTIFLCVLILGVVNASLDMLLRNAFDRIGWWETVQPVSPS